MASTLADAPPNAASETNATGQRAGFDYGMRARPNFTNEEIYAMFQLVLKERQYSTVTQATLIALFSTLIVVGVLGNGLVCAAVIRNRQMRTPRNLFIVNLAVSDMTLCLLSQPLNLVQLLYFPLWNLGDVMCRLVSMLPATNVFVSAMSITAIALDRLQVIAYPTTDIAKKMGIVTALLCIWSVSLLMASPVLVFNGVKDIVEPHLDIVFYTTCLENPDMDIFRSVYSVFTIVCQYILPFCVIVIAHAQIGSKLRARIVNQPGGGGAPSSSAANHSQTQSQAKNRLLAVPSNEAVSSRSSGAGGGAGGGTTGGGGAPLTRREERDRRARKTNSLLVAIALVFAISWLPLNVYNIVADFDQVFISTIDPGRFLHLTCNLFVLCSACINPVLYGWLNDNFYREFVAVWHALQCCCDKNNVATTTVAMMTTVDGRSIATTATIAAKSERMPLTARD